MTLGQFLDHRYVQRPLTVLGLLSGVPLVVGVVTAATVRALELPVTLKVVLIAGAAMLAIAGVDLLLHRARPVPSAAAASVSPVAMPRTTAPIPAPRRVASPAPRPRSAVDLSSLALPVAPSGDARRAAIEAFSNRQNRIAAARLATAQQLAPLYHVGKTLKRNLQIAQVIGVADILNNNAQPQIEREQTARAWDEQVNSVLRAHGDPELITQWWAEPQLPLPHPTRSLIQPTTTASQLSEFVNEKLPRLEAIVASLGDDRRPG